MKRLLNMVWLLLASLPVQVMSSSVSDRDMKAALVYNFSVFTTWPETKSEVFKVCVFYEDQENINPEILESKKINGKSVHLEVIRDKSELENCQVLYLEDTRSIYEPKFIDYLSELSLLTVVDTTHHALLPGIVNIQMENKKYYFSINNEAAKRSNLVLSSKLLRLATKVY